MKTSKDIMTFWFDSKHKPYWFQQNDRFDEKIRKEFLKTYEEGAEGLLLPWRKTLEGRLAEIIVLDQFPRNLFRNSPRSFATDPIAVILAQELVTKPGYEALPLEYKSFAVMPFMHSESLPLHQWAAPYFEGLGTTKEFEERHVNILKEFGRYPYRNKSLERESTPEEMALFGDKQGNFYDPERES